MVESSKIEKDRKKFFGETSLLIYEEFVQLLAIETLITGVWRVSFLQALFGIFDGHGGVKAAEFAAENLDKNILEEVLRRDDEDQIEDAVKRGYLNTDSEFLKEDVYGGSCCVTALIQKGILVVSNAGDCRAVMSRGGLAEALTSDHRPSREDEKNRIETMVSS